MRSFPFLVFVFLAVSTCLFFASATQNRVLGWLCLEFCDETAEQIRNHMITIEDHKAYLDAVSFEKYTLGPNSTLVDNQLTEVSFQLNKMGIETWPLLSSFPHPDEFMQWMRDVFDNPDPFIQSCIEEAKKFQYVGYNLDWEPTTDDVTDEDGNNYAVFIDTFAQALHADGLQLTVDIASWSPIWNITAIAATSADRIISMSTYTSTDSSFTNSLNNLINAAGPERSGVGLENVNASTSGRIPLDEVAWRFDSIEQSGATEIDIWRFPVPPLWWPMIEKYKASGGGSGGAGSGEDVSIEYGDGTCACDQYGGGKCNGFCSGDYCPCMNCQRMTKTC